jgi:hypothetical protein
MEPVQDKYIHGYLFVFILLFLNNVIIFKPHVDLPQAFETFVDLTRLRLQVIYDVQGKQVPIQT